MNGRIVEAHVRHNGFKFHRIRCPHALRVDVLRTSSVAPVHRDFVASKREMSPNRARHEHYPSPFLSPDDRLTEISLVQIPPGPPWRNPPGEKKRSPGLNSALGSHSLQWYGMRACVVFDTRYGNTEKIARSLETGLKEAGVCRRAPTTGPRQPQVDEAAGHLVVASFPFLIFLTDVGYSFQDLNR